MKSKKILSRILAFTAPFLVVFYLLMQLSSRFNSGMTTEYVFEVSAEDVVDASAYLMRSETLLTTAESGIFYNLVDEGEKVSVKQPVVAVYTDSPDVNIQNRIRDIEEKIRTLEASTVDTSYLISDIGALDQSIYENILSIKQNLLSGKTLLALQKRSSLLTLMNKRQLMVNEVSGFDAQIAALKQEKEALYNSLESPKEPVAAAVSGYFSSQIDGYETVFTPDLIDSLTVSGFYDALDQKVSNEGAVGKIITDYTWYVICPLSKEESNEFTENKQYSVIFPYSDSVSIQGKLIKKIAESQQNEQLLIFQMTEMPIDFDYTRAQSVQLCRAVYTGYRISKDAVRHLDGKEGVYILNGSTVNFRTITRLYEAGGYYIVKAASENDDDYATSLHLHDTVLIGGKDLYEGRTLT